MSEIQVKLLTSVTGWAGIKRGDLLKVVKVEANDRGIFAWLEDTFDLSAPTAEPERPSEDIPF